MRELRPSPHAALLLSCCVALCAMTACQEPVDLCDQATVTCTREDARDTSPDHHPPPDTSNPPPNTSPSRPPSGRLESTSHRLPPLSAPTQHLHAQPATTPHNKATPPNKATRPPAILTGRICDSAGTFLADVPVRLKGIDSTSQPVVLEAWTRHGGFFEFQRVPLGTYDVFEFAVNNQTVSDYYTGPIHFPQNTGSLPQVIDFVNADTKRCLARITLNVALVTGNEDEIDNLHINEQLKGLHVTVFDGDRRSQRPGVLPITHLFNGDPLIERFQLLIIESGDWHTLPELHSSFSEGERALPNLEDLDARSTLNSFIQSGGVILVTDWAYPWLEWFDPSMIDFVGDDDQPFEVQVGSHDQSVQTLIHDTALRQHIDNHRGDVQDSAVYDDDPVITFAQPGWAVIQHLGINTRVLIDGLMVSHTGGDTSNASTPLLVEWRPETATGQPTGAILFASFTVWQGHNEAIMRGLLDHVRQSISDL